VVNESKGPESSSCLYCVCMPANRAVLKVCIRVCNMDKGSMTKQNTGQRMAAFPLSDQGAGLLPRKLCMQPIGRQ